MKFTKTGMSRLGFTVWTSVLGITIAFHCGCNSDNAPNSKAANSKAANSNFANPNAVNPSTSAGATGQAQTASTPAASADEARKQRESGKRNDPGAGAVGRPMNPEKFGPPN